MKEDSRNYRYRPIVRGPDLAKDWLEMAASDRARRPRRRNEPVRAECLFKELDGRQLHIGNVDWRVHVFGVFEDRNWRWIQMALEGTRDQMVTMRVTLTHGPAQALQRLSSWLQAPQGSDLRLTLL